MATKPAKNLGIQKMINLISCLISIKTSVCCVIIFSLLTLVFDTLKTSLLTTLSYKDKERKAVVSWDKSKTLQVKVSKTVEAGVSSKINLHVFPEVS